MIGLGRWPRLAGCVVAAWAACAPAAGPDEVIVVRRCSMDFERSAVLGSAINGVLQECLARPGDRVKAGQVLGRLQDQDARAEFELRSAEAEDDVEVRLGEAKRAQAMLRLRASESLSRRNLLSLDDYQIHKLEAETASLLLEQAGRKRHLALLARKQAEAAVRAREIAGPLDGVVTAVLKSPGESVSLGEPVFRVVNVGRIRVVGSIDVADAWSVRAGQAVRVWPDIPGVDLPIEREVFEGKIEFVDALVAPETQTCRVTAVVDNRDGLLRGGLGARMEIRLGAPPAGEKPKAPGAAPEARPADR